MKRSLVFLVVLALGFATLASAQEKTMTQAQLMEMAKAMAAAQGIKVIDEPAAPQQPAATTPAVPQQPAAAQPSTDARRAAVDALLERYPNAYNADGTVGNFDQAVLMQEEIFISTQAQQPDAFYGGMNRYGYGNSFFGNYFHPGFLNAMRNYELRGEFGLLGFTCPRGEGDVCKKAKLFVDGCEVSAVDQLLKAPFKGKLPLPGGARHIVIRNGIRDDPWYYETTVSIQPRAVGQAVDGERYTNIRVGSDLFDKKGVPPPPVCR